MLTIGQNLKFKLSAALSWHLSWGSSTVRLSGTDYTVGKLYGMVIDFRGKMDFPRSNSAFMRETFSVLPWYLYSTIIAYGYTLP